jgi:hypothetical protein
MFFEDKMQAV